MPDDPRPNDVVDDDDVQDPPADQTDDTPDEPEDTPDEPDQSDDDGLGDKGKRALDRMKQKWRDEKARRKELEQELEARNEPDDDQPDPEAIRAEAEREATRKANERIIRSEIRAIAARKLEDPSDAPRFLDLDSFDVNDDGEVDTEEIEDAIDELLKKKPYLAVGNRQPVPDADQGTRGNGGKSQLTREQLKTMTPTEIVTAEAEGRLESIMGRR